MSLPPVYVAYINIPGYLPEGDHPAFDTAAEAWTWLAEERERAEEGSADGAGDGFSATVDRLRELAADPGTEAVGTVGGDTPGYQGRYDLGLVYTVARVVHQDYPHEAGYMINCWACLSRCHCDGESAECVYEGDHDV